MRAYLRACGVRVCAPRRVSKYRAEILKIFPIDIFTHIPIMGEVSFLKPGDNNDYND